MKLILADVCPAMSSQIIVEADGQTGNWTMREYLSAILQIIWILREQEVGTITADVCCRHKINSATYFKVKDKVWRRGSF
jgi:hypothetical protein